MLLEFAGCALAAVGIGLAVWLAVQLWLLPREDGSAWTVLPARGDGAALQEQVRAHSWLYENGLTRTRLLIVDNGLDAEGRKRAELLQRGYDTMVELCPAEQLAQRLGME